MTILITALVVFALAYANGANDNFKGVASLYGSHTCSYRSALGWATVTTLAGSIAAIFLATALLRSFSGKGLVPDTLTGTSAFVIAVATGAGCTVLLATRLGFPISTTHGITGALVGAGLAAGPGMLDFGMLGKTFFMPLLVSPLLAVAVGGTLYLLLKGLRATLGIRSETCVCVGEEWLPVATPTGEVTAKTVLTATVDSTTACQQRYQGRLFGIESKQVIDSLHFLSAGAVSFARGLNDTPKIAALLLATGAWRAQWNLGIVAVAIALGGLLSARRVARTMSHKLTDMNPGQGLAANLSTALLVTTASLHGLPVSTTHVSVGSLLGMGAVTRQAKWKTVLPVLASWVITLPVAVLVSAASYQLIRSIQL